MEALYPLPQHLTADLGQVSLCLGRGWKKGFLPRGAWGFQWSKQSSCSHLLGAGPDLPTAQEPAIAGQEDPKDPKPAALDPESDALVFQVERKEKGDGARLGPETRGEPGAG